MGASFGSLFPSSRPASPFFDRVLPGLRTAALPEEALAEAAGVGKLWMPSRLTSGLPAMGGAAPAQGQPGKAAPRAIGAGTPLNQTAPVLVPADGQKTLLGQ